MGPQCWRVYLESSTEKATDEPAAVMLSTMEVRARMLPCSGESAALRRSEKNNPVTLLVSETRWICLFCVMRVCVNRTHPRCCSSACTALECCSTRGCCSRCCLNWAHSTTPVTMEMHTQKSLSVTVCYDTTHPAPDKHYDAIPHTHTPLRGKCK